MKGGLGGVVRRFLARFGLGLYRLEESILVPRPSPGPPLSDCPGIDWNAPAWGPVLAAVRHHRPVWAAWPRESADARAYPTANPFFGLVDAAVAYALVRERRPTLVVEVGGGYSSRVLRQALDDAGGGELTTIDPEPRRPVIGLADRHLAVAVQEVAPSWFAELPADAVLFIDSSHRGGMGSDVHHLFLEVLPRLRPGVLVHVHDVYLPEEYPESWNVERGFLYSEQYYLQALLADSHGFDVVWPGRHVLRALAAELAQIFPVDELQRHCSFWMERRQP